MDAKRIIWIGAILGGWVGGYVPLLWGGAVFSMGGIICNGLGALLGIWVGFRLSR